MYYSRKKKKERKKKVLFKGNDNPSRYLPIKKTERFEGKVHQSSAEIIS